MTPLTERSAGLLTRTIPDNLSLSDYKLIAFDMDSTLINIECIDEIADAAGRKAEVSAITEAAMRGEIKDFKGATFTHSLSRGYFPCPTRNSL